MQKGVHMIWDKLGTAARAELYRQYLSSEIHEDPTVATLSTMCPTCSEKKVVRYVRYGKGLDFLYACPDCATFWTCQSGGSSKIVSALSKA